MHIFKWNVQKSAIKINDWSANCQKPQLMDSVTSVNNSFKCTQVTLKANKVRNFVIEGVACQPPSS